jgi:hypothetical protein
LGIVIILGLYVLMKRKMKSDQGQDPFVAIREQKLRNSLLEEGCEHFALSVDSSAAVGLASDCSSLILAIGGKGLVDPESKQLRNIGPTDVNVLEPDQLLGLKIVRDLRVNAKSKGKFQNTEMRRLDLVFRSEKLNCLSHRIRLIDGPVKIGSDAYYSAMEQARYWEGVVLALVHPVGRADLVSDRWEEPPDFDAHVL